MLFRMYVLMFACVLWFGALRSILQPVKRTMYYFAELLNDDGLNNNVAIFVQGIKHRSSPAPDCIANTCYRLKNFIINLSCASM